LLKKAENFQCSEDDLVVLLNTFGIDGQGLTKPQPEKLLIQQLGLGPVEQALIPITTGYNSPVLSFTGDPPAVDRLSAMLPLRDQPVVDIIPDSSPIRHLNLRVIPRHMSVSHYTRVNK